MLRWWCHPSWQLLDSRRHGRLGRELWVTPTSSKNCVNTTVTMYTLKSWKDLRITSSLKAMTHKSYRDNLSPLVSLQTGLFCWYFGKRRQIETRIHRFRQVSRRWRLLRNNSNRRFQSRHMIGLKSRLHLKSRKYPFKNHRTITWLRSTSSRIWRQYQSIWDH